MLPRPLTLVRHYHLQHHRTPLTRLIRPDSQMHLFDQLVQMRWYLTCLKWTTDIKHNYVRISTKDDSWNCTSGMMTFSQNITDLPC